jgi:hypothetical protein
MCSFIQSEYLHWIEVSGQPIAPADFPRRKISRYSPHKRLGGPRKFGKGKAIPLQAWTDPEGSRRLRLPDYKTIGT